MNETWFRSFKQRKPPEELAAITELYNKKENPIFKFVCNVDWKNSKEISGNPKRGFLKQNPRERERES